MILKRYFFPDIMLHCVGEINVKGLSERGVKFALIDIDNTLVPYTCPEPTEEALGFLKKLTDNNIVYSFVSNNSESRVGKFNENIGASFYARAKKPLLYGVNRAMIKLGATKDNTILIGDQIFTDVMAGKRAGLYTILVEPIIECETLFFKFKRFFEKKIIKKYQEESMKND